ncbi:MAG: putative NH(3)-dependent NAD(+) synthetase [Methanocella sp. PtaU1.Bin125]|nr:MAG: putative NH(3)-dependent NAD(+) synthetase [Methanocella sp. PtaU1.Bin125]
MMKGLELPKESLVKVENAITDAIVRVVELSNSSGAIVGLSGGIDSALVATLASRAVDVHALLLPDRASTSREDMEHAKALARDLGIDHEVIEIGDIVGAVYAKRPGVGPEECRLAFANVKPRVRMIMSYFAANLDGRIVLGTGNKTELLMGYFTKYGDGGVDMLPIGDLYKTRVRQLARHVGVPEAIIKKPPSAGLWAGQTDEAEMGATYEEIDAVLYGTFDLGMSLDHLEKATGVGNATVRMIMERVRNSEHKRSMPPIVGLDEALSGI